MSLWNSKLAACRAVSLDDGVDIFATGEIMGTRQFLILLSVIVVTQALGFTLLLHQFPHPQRYRPVQSEQNPPARYAMEQIQNSDGALNPSQSAALQVRIEDMLRRALVNVLSEQSGRPPAAESTGQVPSPSAEQQEAADEAMSVINNAISAGVWTSQDNQALMPYAGKLTHAQRVEIINRFAQALQNRQLTLQGPPPAL